MIDFFYFFLPNSWIGLVDFFFYDFYILWNLVKRLVLACNSWRSTTQTSESHNILRITPTMNSKLKLGKKRLKFWEGNGKSRVSYQKEWKDRVIVRSTFMQLVYNLFPIWVKYIKIPFL